MRVVCSLKHMKAESNVQGATAVKELHRLCEQLSMLAQNKMAAIIGSIHEMSRLKYMLGRLRFSINRPFDS